MPAYGSKLEGIKRRAKIRELMRQGVRASEMVKIVGVSEAAIYKHIRIIKEEDAQEGASR